MAKVKEQLELVYQKQPQDPIDEEMKDIEDCRPRVVTKVSLKDCRIATVDKKIDHCGMSKLKMQKIDRILTANF